MILFTEDVFVYARIDDTNSDAMQGFLIYCAEALGIPWVMDYKKDEFENEQLTNSFSHYMVNQKDIPTLTVELELGGRADPKFIALGEAIIHKAMGQFQMRRRDLKKKDESFGEDPSILLKSIKKIGDGITPLRLADAYAVNSERINITDPGILELSVKPGNFIHRGDLIGFLVNPYSLQNNRKPVFSSLEGWVLSSSGKYILRKGKGFAFLGAVYDGDQRLRDIYEEQKARLTREEKTV